MSLQLEVRQLALGGVNLVNGLRLAVAPGSVHTVMGASGSGKSSLLAAVCGTLPSAFVFDGSVLLQGRRIDHLPTEQRQVGLLFQDDLLFAHMTVRENLLFALPAGPRAAREASVAQALAELALDGFAHADPATLSGGQRARVALMRALLAQPRALLLDEPFARFSRLRRQLGTTALLVTHDPADIADPACVTRL